MPISPRRAAAVALLIASLAIGCGGMGASATAPAGATVPVKGTVTYKGQTLTEGAVVFHSDDAGRDAHGSIGPDGSFTLTTFREGDGALRGTYRVGITGKAGKSAVPAKYRSATGSSIELDMADGNADYPITLN